MMHGKTSSQSRIQDINDISKPSYIIAGDEIIIPYTIDRDDLSYYTYSVEFDRGTSLEEFASIYDTDVDGLIKLNEDCYITGEDLLDINFKPNFNVDVSGIYFINTVIGTDNEGNKLNIDEKVSCKHNNALPYRI